MCGGIYSIEVAEAERPRTKCNHWHFLKCYNNACLMKSEREKVKNIESEHLSVLQFGRLSVKTVNIIYLKQQIILISSKDNDDMQ